MQLLRTLLIILLVWYGFKIFLRLLGPYIIKYVSKKVKKKFSQQFGQPQNQRHQETNYREGETVIEKTTAKSDVNSSKKVGEYIEFEEID